MTDVNWITNAIDADDHDEWVAQAKAALVAARQSHQRRQRLNKIRGKS
jgi:hypothetical protein